MNKLVFITRATKESGKGHFIRVLRTAEELKKRRDCIIVVDQDAIDLTNKRGIDFESLDLEKPDSFIEHIGLTSEDIIWFDIPDSQYSLIEHFTGRGIPLVSMNMFEKRDSKHRFEDIAIYPVFDVMTKERLGELNNTVQLSGSGFISVPAAFFSETHETEDTVLVSMGGTDPMGFTPWVLQAISDLGHCSFKFKVILPVGMQKADLLKIYHQFSHIEMHNFGQLNFATELKKARYALINGGMTRYECIAANTFFIALSIHELQASLSEKVTQFGYGYNFGVFEKNSIKQLTQYLSQLPKKPAIMNNLGKVPTLKVNNAIWMYEKILSELNYENE